jgi:hypothetical protein
VFVDNIDLCCVIMIYRIHIWLLDGDCVGIGFPGGAKVGSVVFGYGGVGCDLFGRDACDVGGWCGEWWG